MKTVFDNGGYLGYKATFGKSLPVLVSTSQVLLLDANDPASYPGTGTTWYDLSGAGNNGTLTNGPTYSTSGGGSIVFDGSDDYVNCSTVTKTANCTFSCWAKTTMTLTQPMLFLAGPDGAGPDLFFYSSTISWNTWDGNAASFGAIPASANNGNWHNYVVVTDSVANNTKLYYDGSLLGTTTYKSAAANAGVRIGGTISLQWNGSVAHFMVNNIALTADQVTANFNALRGRFGV